MRLWDEAPRLDIFGVEVYQFGLYCAIGAICAGAVMLLILRFSDAVKGSGLLSVLLCLVCGGVCSRLAFCLMNQEVTGMVPFSAWPRITAGGWSMFGGIFGAFLGAWISALITRQSPRLLLDATACGLPLFIAAERLGEAGFEGFDVSRKLSGGFPENTFLAVKDSVYDSSFLATFRLAAICAMILFFVVVLCLLRKERKTGDLWILFMIIGGACGVLLESLRYDHFMEYSFVCFQQVMSAVMLAWGVVMAGVRGKQKRKGLFIAAMISLPAAIGICVGIEFAVDRTNVSHILLYAAMILALSIPATLGILLMNTKGQDAR